MPKGVYKRKKRTAEHCRNLSIAQKKIGNKPPSRKGIKDTLEMIEFKRKRMTGNNNPIWKGEKAGKDAMHDWVKRWKGYPKKCEMCGTEEAKTYDWANIDHSYKRILEDYIRMCRSCHRKFDIKNNNYKTNEKFYTKS